MIVHFKFDFNAVCKKVLNEHLEKYGIEYKEIGFGEIDIIKKTDQETYNALISSLAVYGIAVVENQKTILVQKIKDVIVDMVFNDETVVNLKMSAYLSEQVGHSYGYLSNLFTEVTYTSIENFTILQKIERTKQLIIKDNLSLTEIAFKLNYSSVAHLSAQFKNTTGITPSAFQRIIEKRRQQKIN